jgi:hypothetical protein
MPSCRSLALSSAMSAARVPLPLAAMTRSCTHRLV